MADEQNKSDDMNNKVSKLMDSVFSSVDPHSYDDEVEQIINRNEVLHSDDPKLCPRAVHLERNPEIVLPGDDSSAHKSLGDTGIDEVDHELTEEGFCNISPGDYFSDSCPMHFRADDFLSRDSEESFETVDLRSKPQYNDNSCDSDYMDEAIIKLKREILEEESEEEDVAEDPVSTEQPFLSSPVLDELKSPKKISDQERQNILASLIHAVEKKVRERQKAEQRAKTENKTGETSQGNTEEYTETEENKTANINDSPAQDLHADNNAMPNLLDDDMVSYLDEGTAHLRESLLSVLEALKYVFQSGRAGENRPECGEDTAEHPSEDTSTDTGANICNESTQTCCQLGMVGEERVEADLLIAGLQEEFQRCLWIHQKLTEEAHQIGFEQGVQNALFLQDLIEQGVQMIWSLREERKQLEKYMKDKERDWSAMSRGFTQEVLDLRRENVQLLTSVAGKDGGRGGRRIKSPHLKSLLKSKHDLEKAFCLNVEKQDKINELKLLVLQQQKCIRSLQERLIEEQAAALMMRNQGGDHSDRDPQQDQNHNDPADGRDEPQTTQELSPPNDDDVPKGSTTLENNDPDTQTVTAMAADGPVPNSPRTGVSDSGPVADSPSKGASERGPLVDSLRTGESERGPLADSICTGAFEHGPVADSPRTGVSERGPVEDSPSAGASDRGPVADSPRTGASERMRVEDMAKLQDVLYCDHARFTTDQSRSPEIAAMQVYGIGGEELSTSVSHSSPTFNVMELKYTKEKSSPVEDIDSFGLEALDISKSENSTMASGDTL